MGKRSKNYIGLIKVRKEDKLSKIFLEDNPELIPIYLAGFVDGCCTICIRAKSNGKRLIPTVDVQNISACLTEYLCKKYKYKLSNCEKDLFQISGIKAYYFIKGIYPYLLRLKNLAKYILVFGLERNWDNYSMYENATTYRKTLTLERLKRELNLAISIRSKNQTKSGRKIEDLKKLIQYYKDIFNEDPKIINIIDESNNNELHYIFYEREEGKKFTERQLVYIAGYFDSKRSFSFKNTIPEVKLYKKGNKKISEFIKDKYEKNSICFLDGYKAIDLTKKVYDFLITNKDKASYLLDWYNNIGNEKKQYEIIYKSLINYPYEQGNHSKSLQILKKRYKNRFGIELT